MPSPPGSEARERGMEVEVSAEAKDKRLNRLVAITVVILSVFMGVSNIKDGNIVQAMAQAQANAIDRWGEYQATRTKTHVAEAARTEILTLGGASSSPQAIAAVAGFNANIARHERPAPDLAAQGRRFTDGYDARNVHGDQVDASQAA